MTEETTGKRPGTTADTTGKPGPAAPPQSSGTRKPAASVQAAPGHAASVSTKASPGKSVPGRGGKPAPRPNQEADRLRSLLLRFLKSLSPAGAQICPQNAGPQGSGSAGTASGAVVELATPTARLRVETRILVLAAREGLIAREGARIRPLPEAAGFIARHATAEPDFARPHRDLEETMLSVDGETARVTRNQSESPLSALERLKGRAGETYFPREAMAAGERLHADFTRGLLQPQITMRFEPRLGASIKGARGGIADLSDTAIAARLRVNRALAALGPELSGVALDICCFMKGLETVERERQWPPRSAKLMLKTALLALHRHYTPPARRETRHWGEEGFRPEM
ncbi:DUF6456 domain-containing protein [Rhizobium sp. C4]|uniref:DUF6456 domain-containing protein n=1 Tax=Rhizobium sp. C4 TaxID=1349800 RepID=UPI001E563903|nr:DUF6456 domain-containing protein [Rhizobium sp. C4]MCD2175558.1 DUF6456 domain-containing protein [Rhizobium sp. C4]